MLRNVCIVVWTVHCTVQLPVEEVNHVDWDASECLAFYDVEMAVQKHGTILYVLTEASI